MSQRGFKRRVQKFASQEKKDIQNLLLFHSTFLLKKGLEDEFESYLLGKEYKQTFIQKLKKCLKKLF